MTARSSGYRAISDPDSIRRLANLLQYGTVEEVQYGKAGKPRVRVRVGKRLTGWIPFSQARSGDNREWNPLDIGEQVMIAAPSGDMAQAAVIATLPRDERPAPGESPNTTVRTYKDGSREEHNRETKEHTLTIPAGGKYTVKCGASTLEMTNDGVTITTPKYKTDAPDSEFTGEVTVRGLLTYLRGLIGRVAGGGAVAKMYGNVEHSDGIFKSNDVSISEHEHPDTGKPIKGT